MREVIALLCSHTLKPHIVPKALDYKALQEYGSDFPVENQTLSRHKCQFRHICYAASATRFDFGDFGEFCAWRAFAVAGVGRPIRGRVLWCDAAIAAA